jgi:hypothetical protein
LVKKELSVNYGKKIINAFNPIFSSLLVSLISQNKKHLLLHFCANLLNLVVKLLGKLLSPLFLLLCNAFIFILKYGLACTK